MSKKFPPQYYEQSDNCLAQIDKDLQRIIDLWNKYQHPGLNSIESSELNRLMSEYGFEAYYELDEILDYTSPY